LKDFCVVVHAGPISHTRAAEARKIRRKRDLFIIARSCMSGQGEACQWLSIFASMKPDPAPVPAPGQVAAPQR
jgi:hypothetical protein